MNPDAPGGPDDTHAPGGPDDTHAPGGPPDRSRSRPVVAAFDFDGTLTRGGSVWSFLAAISGRRRLLATAVVLAGQLALAALLGGRFADDAKEALFRRTLAGLPADEVLTAAAAFGLDHYRRQARPDVRHRLEWHRARGHVILIVSASPEIYLASVAEALGVDAVVATRLAVDGDGRLTGDYDGSNCRGLEKMARVRQWVDESTRDTTGATAITPLLWAYGNSQGDKQLLGGADIGVDVGRLGRLGALRSFRRLSDLPDDGGDDGSDSGDDGDERDDGVFLTRSGGRSGTSSAVSPGTRWRRRSDGTR